MTTTTTNDRKKDLRAAYLIAQHQYNCHSQMVSGVWRISGRDYTTKWDLDYDAAIQSSDESYQQDLDNYYDEKLREISRYITITDEQRDELWEKIGNDLYHDEEDAAFWKNIMDQIEYELKYHFDGATPWDEEDDEEEE